MLRCVVLSILLLSGLAVAQVPESGNWWNPAEPGRGFTVEIQDDFAFITGYVYDAEGASVWLTAQGTLDPRTGVLEASFNLTQGGQCLGCSYVAPTLLPVQSVRFRFDSAVSGQIELDGHTIAIERFGFVHGSDFVSILPGVWHTTEGVALTNGEFLWIRDTFPDLEQGLVGRTIGSASRPLLGAFDADVGYLILLDSSTSFYRAYLIETSLDRFEGRTWLFRKTETATGAGLPFIASRVAGLQMWERLGSQRPLAFDTLKASPAEDVRTAALLEQRDELNYALQEAEPVEPGDWEKTADQAPRLELLRKMAEVLSAE